MCKINTSCQKRFSFGILWVCKLWYITSSFNWWRILAKRFVCCRNALGLQIWVINLICATSTSLHRDANRQSPKCNSLVACGFRMARVWWWGSGFSKDNWSSIGCSEECWAHLQFNIAILSIRKIQFWKTYVIIFYRKLYRISFPKSIRLPPKKVCSKQTFRLKPNCIPTTIWWANFVNTPSFQHRTSDASELGLSVQNSMLWLLVRSACSAPTYLSKNNILILQVTLKTFIFLSNFFTDMFLRVRYNV